mgnify:CR=1 FL=1
MIYPASFEQKIGFDRLREQVAALCTMRAARERIASEQFSTSPREIERRLALADEMRLLLDMEHDFPGGEYPDIDQIVAKLRVEGTFLDVEEVVTLHRALSALGGVISFILNRQDRYPTLWDRTHGVAAFPEIVRRIDAIVDRFGNVRDNASPALQEIRRAIREREGQAAKRLQEAQAYREAVVNKAKGDAERFISVYNAYKQGKEITAKRLYLETMEGVLANSRKVILDPSAKSGNVLPILPLNRNNQTQESK